MLELYKKRLQASGSYMGEALKNQSDMIMNETFKRDTNYRLCYIDDEPVDAKYITYTYYSISKDAVDYHLQFRPGVHYPMGKYVDIPDDTGTYNRWIIVGRSDEPQFVKYNILKCNWTFKWIANGVIHECLGVLRKRNSYNSGLWHDYLLTTPENQNQALLPTTPETQTINYNMRFLISDNQINPIAWEVSKREDTFPVGVTYITFKQDLFNPHRDNKELMIADYYNNPSIDITPDNKPDKEYSIKCSSPICIKVGGSYKIFSVQECSNNDVFSWAVNGLDPDQYSSIFNEDNSAVFKLKASKDYSLVGKTFYLELYYKEKLVDKINVKVVSI